MPSRLSRNAVGGIRHKEYRQEYSASTVLSVTWNPEVQGFHFFAVFNGSFSSVTINLSGSYVPQIGDILTLTVAHSSLDAVQVVFLNRIFDKGNTPIQFMYTETTAGAADWRVISQDPHNSETTGRLALGLLKQEFRWLSPDSSFPNPSSPSTYLQTFAAQLSNGKMCAAYSYFSSGNPVNGLIWLGDPDQPFLRLQGPGAPVEVANVWVSGSTYLAVGSTPSASTTSHVVRFEENAVLTGVTLPATGAIVAATPKVFSNRVLLPLTSGSDVRLFYSEDFGVTWDFATVSGTAVAAVYLSSNHVYYSFGNNLFRTTNALFPNGFTNVLTTVNPITAIETGFRDSIVVSTGSTGALYTSVLGDAGTWVSGWAGLEAAKYSTALNGCIGVGPLVSSLGAREVFHGYGWRNQEYKLTSTIPTKLTTVGLSLPKFNLYEGGDGLYYVGKWSLPGDTAAAWGNMRPALFRYWKRFDLV